MEGSAAVEARGEAQRHTSRPRRGRDVLLARLPWLILAVAVLASFAWIVSRDVHLTFISDDWELLVGRQGTGSSYFLDSFNGNILVGQALVYKALLALFGMGSATPYFVLSISAFLLSAVLLFIYLRRRTGGWPALIAAILLLFLDAAFEDLLFAFQIGYFASVAAGLGMLIALDREDDRGDWIASGLLVISVLFSSIGIAFAVAALADLLFGRRPWERRIHVVAWAALVYGIWWVGWGRHGESHVSFDNLIGTPEYAFNAAGAGITSLLGLATNDGSQPSQPHLIWGKLLLVLFTGLVCWRIHREGGLSRGMAVALGFALSLWFFTGLNQYAERMPTSSRYQYPSAVALLLIAGETLRGVRVPKLAVVVAAVVTGLALWGGISLLQREYTERWRPVGDSLRTTLGAVDIAGSRTVANFPIAFAPTPEVQARVYLDVASRYGSPAWDETELEARPLPELNGADLTIAQALGLGLRPPRRDVQVLACEPLEASESGETGTTLLHGGFSFTNQGEIPVEVMLSRFSSELSVSFGPIEPGQKASLRIPVDNSKRPWNLGLKGAGPVQLCTTS
jgi:hypothetical protein